MRCGTTTHLKRFRVVQCENCNSVTHLYNGLSPGGNGVLAHREQRITSTLGSIECDDDDEEEEEEVEEAEEALENAQDDIL
ncbi:hypothetical protein SBOR_2696 [Sclerotinia borealis F-4128]|uniref:Uncharacterized protein n=1 Tax=Sclerotinia borealis (strain F-4128) TaxID=1432307 RepID=W9CJG6_SCLBF|nr:hypothetical protein SBOR_2696 [Sclerotinia borealis F-4128]